MREESKYEFFGCFQIEESVRQSGVKVRKILRTPTLRAKIFVCYKSNIQILYLSTTHYIAYFINYRIKSKQLLI